MTAAFHRDTSGRLFVEPTVFLRGYEPNQRQKREAPWKPEDIVILTNGACASAYTIFTGLMVRNFSIRTIALGERPLNRVVNGTEILNNADNKRLVTNLVQEIQRSSDGQGLRRSIRGVPNTQDPPILQFLEDLANGGSVNVRNAYSGDDADGFPLHFKYGAANCRLFYTLEMVLNVTESWRQAAKIAWVNGTCVPGSTVKADGRIGKEAPAFDPSVRGKATGIPRPGLKTATGTSSPTTSSTPTPIPSSLSPSTSPSCKCQI